MTRCPACGARLVQLSRASAAGVAARQAEAARIEGELVALLTPMLRRDHRLSARAAAHRLVVCGAIEPELEDRCRRIGGRLRVALAVTADHHQPGTETMSKGAGAAPGGDGV